MTSLYEKISSNSNNFTTFGNTKYIEGSKDFLESNSLVAKLGFLLLVIFIFIIVLRLGISILSYIFSNSENPVLINGMIDGEQLFVIPQNPNVKNSIPIKRSINERDGLEFTWSVWVWLKNPPLSNNPSNNLTQYKHIFNKGNDNIGTNGLVTPNNAPGLYIGPDYRSLVVVMNTFDDIKEEIVIDDIPIEKWINVIIRCDQHKLDVYINGTLTKSHILDGVPKQNYGDVYVALNGGFAGRISSLRYFASAIGINKIQSIVENGPNMKTKDSNITTTKPYYLSFRWFFPEQIDSVNL